MALSCYSSRFSCIAHVLQMLHGEQYLELFAPLPTSGVLTSKATVVDVLDKGSGANLIINGRQLRAPRCAGCRRLRLFIVSVRFLVSIGR